MQQSITEEEVRAAIPKPYEPRDYQIRIIKKVYESFASGLESVMIESPTGSGKTALSLMSLKLIKKELPNIKFGWVAMRRNLLKQAAEENKRIGVTDIEFISMFDSNPPKCDLMIMDECQHSAAKTCVELYTKTGSSKYLGMSATPMRTDRVKLAFQRTIRDCGVRFLIEKGYLAPFNLYALPRWDVDEVVSKFLLDPEHWGKSVIYMKDREQCYELQERLGKGGVKSEVMLGSHSMTVREGMFDRFDSGESQALINVNLLIEGFDAPDMKTVWVRDSSKLPTIQMSGRVLRKDPNNPDKVAHIVQSDETSFPYTKVAKARKEFIWKNGWKSLESNDQIDRIIENVRKRVLVKDKKMPSYFGKTPTSVRVDRHGSLRYNDSNRSNPLEIDF